MWNSRNLPILTYHSLDDSGSVLSTPPKVFAQQMQILAALNIKVGGLADVRRAVCDGGLGEPLVAITFDDGFRNFYDQAFPVLQRYRFPATVFLVTDYCGGLNSWPSQPLEIAHQPLLSWDQIKEMSRAGIAFGSHTRSHPILTAVSQREAEEEIVGSKRTIEDAIGQSVSAFAYPYGSFHDGVKKLASAHFALACATTLGFVQPGSDLFALDRLDMYYFRRVSLLRHLFSPAVAGYIRVRRMMRGLRARIAAVA